MIHKLLIIHFYNLPGEDPGFPFFVKNINCYGDNTYFIDFNNKKNY